MKKTLKSKGDKKDEEVYALPIYLNCDEDCCVGHLKVTKKLSKYLSQNNYRNKLMPYIKIKPDKTKQVI